VVIEICFEGVNLKWPKGVSFAGFYIKATATEDVSLHQSSFGYYPCIPKEFDYPKGENGNYLYPLAQINFSEFPNIQGYPTSGYLQFYIAR